MNQKMYAKDSGSIFTSLVLPKFASPESPPATKPKTEPSPPKVDPGRTQPERPALPEKETTPATKPCPGPCTF